MPRCYRSGALWGYDCVACDDFIVGKPDATGMCEHCKSKAECPKEIARKKLGLDKQVLR